MTAGARAGVRGTGRILRRARPLLGTVVAVTVRGRSPERLRGVAGAMFREAERLQAMLSEWTDTSAVAAVADAAGRRPVRVPGEVVEVVETALAVSALTAGAFDPTWRPLAEVWRFHGPAPRRPCRREVLERLALVDHREVIVDKMRGTVFLRRPGMRLGLGGVAKAFIAERMAALAVAMGVGDVLVDAGGDVVARGRNGARPWTVAIRDPRRPGGAIAIAELGDGAVATSGDYEACFVSGGRRHHHLLDPATGYPARGTRSVTVVARSAALADALATGLFVLGAERGRAVAAGLPGVAALWLRADGRVEAVGAAAGASASAVGEDGEDARRARAGRGARAVSAARRGRSAGRRCGRDPRRRGR